MHRWVPTDLERWQGWVHTFDRCNQATYTRSWRKQNGTMLHHMTNHQFSYWFTSMLHLKIKINQMPVRIYTRYTQHYYFWLDDMWETWSNNPNPSPHSLYLLETYSAQHEMQIYWAKKCCIFRKPEAKSHSVLSFRPACVPWLPEILTFMSKSEVHAVGRAELNCVH